MNNNITILKKFNFTIRYFQELYYRLLYSLVNLAFIFLITYTYKQTLIYLILPVGITHFITTELTELFISYLYLCGTLSFFSLTIILTFQLYLFLRPGLFSYEANKYFKLILICIIFYVNMYINIYPILIQMSWDFFSQYPNNFNSLTLNFELKFLEYIKHIHELALMGILIYTITVLGIIMNLKHTITYRTPVYIGLFILAAIITPPDPISQILIGFILLLLYEFGIFNSFIKNSYQNIN